MGSAGSRIWGVSAATLGLSLSSLLNAWVATMPRLKYALNGGRFSVKVTLLLTNGSMPVSGVRVPPGVPPMGTMR